MIFLAKTGLRCLIPGDVIYSLIGHIPDMDIVCKSLNDIHHPRLDQGLDRSSPA